MVAQCTQKTTGNIWNYNLLKFMYLGVAGRQLDIHAWNGLNRQLLSHSTNKEVAAEWDTKLMVKNRMVKVILWERGPCGHFILVQWLQGTITIISRRS
jgi:hypothetical protein